MCPNIMAEASLHLLISLYHGRDLFTFIDLSLLQDFDDYRLELRHQGVSITEGLHTYPSDGPFLILIQGYGPLIADQLTTSQIGL